MKPRFIRKRTRDECLPPGDYPATLWRVAEETSKKGNPMTVLAWRVVVEGEAVTVRDYLLHASFRARRESLCRAWGLPADADLAAEKGRYATVRLEIEEDEVYGARNAVSSYLPFPNRPTTGGT